MAKILGFASGRPQFDYGFVIHHSASYTLLLWKIILAALIYSLFCLIKFFTSYHKP
jgi:hypothetical protein